MVSPLSVSVLHIGDDSWRVLAAGELRMTNAWAARLGVPKWGGASIGSLILDATGTTQDKERHDGEPVQFKQTAAQASTRGIVGPDVLVVGLFGKSRYQPDTATGITGYSFGSSVCNVGDEPLAWNGETQEHPIVAQNFYRLKEGRFEQIGMSWVKHAFDVGGPDACGGVGCNPSIGLFDCCDPTEGTLGPHCRDAYSPNLNGFQSNLGPRWEVNATTGEFLFPFGVGLPEPVGEQARRLQIHDSDLAPASNPAALYFMEAQYVAQDDAVAGNQANNASHWKTIVNVFDPNPPPRYELLQDFSPGVDLVEGEPAIMAWQIEDPSVGISIVDVPDDGRFILGHKTTDRGDGTWQYEYALHNLYSDRSAQSFGVPLPPGTAVSNGDFHDVNSHSGSPISNIDWTPALSAEAATWATETFDVNPNANAIRWGTLYNFRFQADVQPAWGCVTVGLFKPGDAGAPDSFEASAMVPLGATLEESSPPDGAIDARQPSDIDGSNPTGWQEVTWTFSACASVTRAADFDVTQEGGVLPAPTVAQVEHLGGNTITVRLSRPMEPRAWTTISHVSGASVRLGYLPGDVNGDGTTNPALDLTALIDCLNQPGTCNDWQANIDRSEGTPGVLDITRLIDLLNGAGSYDSFAGARLP